MPLDFLRIVRRLLAEVEIRLERKRSGIEPLATRDNGKRKEIETLLDSLKLDEGASAYLAGHRRRIVETLEIVPLGQGKARALELGSYLQMAAVLRRVLGYEWVEGAYYAAEPGQHRKSLAIEGQPPFECNVHLFDAERHRFPFGDSSFDLILCCELIEHLAHDPMHMLLECRRTLAPGGRLALTTPNAASLSSVAAALHGWRNPQVFSRYPKAGNEDMPHVREYTPGGVGVRRGSGRVPSGDTDHGAHGWIGGMRLGESPAGSGRLRYEPAGRANLLCGAETG